MDNSTFKPLNNVLRVLSWGCGVQSTMLAVMSALGDLEPLDVVMTAETHWERKATYEVRNFYIKWLQDRGVRVEIVLSVMFGGMARRIIFTYHFGLQMVVRYVASVPGILRFDL